MNKKKLVFITLIICSIIFNIYQNKQIKKLNTELSKTRELNDLTCIKKKDTQLKEGENSNNELSKSYELDTLSTVNKEDIQLIEGCDIRVLDKINDISYFPSCGPLATLNPDAINNIYDNPRIKILNQENKFFTRISIEGFIPTWTIGTNDFKLISDVDNKMMYILDSCKGFLGPSDKSGEITILSKGDLVTITKEYEDWYYVTFNVMYDSCEYPTAWVKKSNLGYYDSFDTNIGIQVEIKDGSPLYLENGETLIAENHLLSGTIEGETNEQYEISFPGATSTFVDKKYINPFIKNPSN